MEGSNLRFLIQSQASYHWTNPQLSCSSGATTKGGRQFYGINGLESCQGGRSFEHHTHLVRPSMSQLDIILLL